jgi:hypothetical protein
VCRATILAFTVVAVTIACVPAPAHKPVPTEETPAEGRTSSRFVFDPGNPALGLPKDVEFHPPQPLGRLGLPDYPVTALAAREDAVVGVRFVVNPEGAVGTVLPSPLVASTGGTLAGEFQAAAEAAVRGWKFVPGWIARLEEGNDLDGDGKPDYKRAVELRNISVYLDVRFDFELTEGDGKVRASITREP